MKKCFSFLESLKKEEEENFIIYTETFYFVVNLISIIIKLFAHCWNYVTGVITFFDKLLKDNKSYTCSSARAHLQHSADCVIQVHMPCTIAAHSTRGVVSSSSTICQHYATASLPPSLANRITACRLNNSFFEPWTTRCARTAYAQISILFLLSSSSFPSLSFS